MEKCVAHGKTDLSMAGYKSLVGTAENFLINSGTFYKYPPLDKKSIILLKSYSILFIQNINVLCSHFFTIVFCTQFFRIYILRNIQESFHAEIVVDYIC